jgi:hypothetical protein
VRVVEWVRVRNLRARCQERIPQQVVVLRDPLGFRGAEEDVLDGCLAGLGRPGSLVLARRAGQQGIQGSSIREGIVDRGTVAACGLAAVPTQQIHDVGCRPRPLDAGQGLLSKVERV